MIDQSLIDIATTLCTLLEGEWYINQDHSDSGYSGVSIETPGGKALNITIPYNNKTRLEIRGSWLDGLSQHTPCNHESTHITVLQSKTPEQIARDITKRLLPPYERVLAQAREAKAAHDKQEAHKQKVLESLQAVMPNATIRNDEVYQYEPHRITVKYCSYSDGDVQLELTVPAEKALEILKGLNRGEA